MTIKYKSELIKDIVDTRGHEKSSLHYESECIGSWIEETKGGYPKLCDYESEWLNYIIANEIGKFPYETVIANPTATVSNVVPYSYKSAILKGSTKYRDIDTGEVLDAFEDGRNLELVSVRMPGLTATGKNLFDGELEIGWINTEGENAPSTQYVRTKSFTNVLPQTNYTFNSIINGVYFYDCNRHFISVNYGVKSFTTPSDCFYIRFAIHDTNQDLEKDVQIEQGSIATPYEPYKSNILTVNEDVELGSVGEVKDELDLLTGKISQRTDIRPYQEGDESNSEVLTDMTNTRYKLAQEVVKTVDLTVVNQDNETSNKIKPLEGTMNIKVTGNPVNPIGVFEVPFEAITQNLNSFIKEE